MSHKAFAGLVVTILLLVTYLPTAGTEPNGQAIVVTSAADSGPGTLRQAVENAQSGDTITFDAAVFPPTAPATICITSELPGLPGNLTLDASNAGVILDGSNMPSGWMPGLQIVSSHGNTIWGLQVRNFSGRGIDISGDSQYNLIGGDRSVGAGPYGQGNLLIQNGTGVILSTAGASLNTITGNLIGTDATGESAWGNNTGVWIVEGANGNVIGPDNVVAHNVKAGIRVDDSDSVHNTVTRNSIHDNGWAGIVLWGGGNADLPAPTIIDFDAEAGTVAGLTCAGCTVEIFSDEDADGAIYEGQTASDATGDFALDKGSPFAGPHLTATATDASGNTSAFSAPARGGETVVVTSAADSGAGTLRQALEDAWSGDTITFDPAIFPPTAPVTISLTSELPHMWRDNLTLDASNAGVILDGTNVPGEWQACLQIVNSHGNTVRGLQITNFSGAGIAISGESQFNVIGGDRSVGAGPFGQGNLFTHDDVGVVLSSPGTSHNTVAGNLIGTDASGIEEWGNTQQGLWITEATSKNIIGPDNVIAHNGRIGIEVDGRETVGNTITRNSIHDHPWRGIYLPWANNQQVEPTIFGFDLSAGTVVGTTCAGCTVEVFSDSGDEGARFEGQATADSAGAFTFSKGAPLQGPNLTATTTNLDGDTSEFSLPTPGMAAGSLTLQDGNGLPPSHLQTWPSRDLADNGMGTGFVGYANPGTWDELVYYRRGLKRARVAIQAQEPEYIRWEWPDLYIPPGYEDVFTRMAENGLKVKLLLTFWDKATWPDGEGAPCARFKTEGEIERYLEFVQYMVHHFKDRIQYYELWNEPDIANYCPKWIEVEDYINLVRRTVPVIRAEYPEAKIVVGAVSGIRHPGAYPYLLAILESDVMPLVDVVSWHPFYGESPQFEETRDYYYAYPSIVQEIKGVASAHGFTGEYQVDELTWWTPHEFGDNDPLVQSRTTAAKYASRAIVMHLGMDVAVDFNAGAGNTYPNLCTVMAGARPADLPLHIQTTATNTMSYTFSLAGDRQLVALWTNGIAAEYDLGITATVTISGFTGYDTCTGIDVLHGFEQPLTTSVDNGNLVIRDLLVKDYPMIIRLSSTKYVHLPILLKEQPW